MSEVFISWGQFFGRHKNPFEKTVAASAQENSKSLHSPSFSFHHPLNGTGHCNCSISIGVCEPQISMCTVSWWPTTYARIILCSLVCLSHSTLPCVQHKPLSFSFLFLPYPDHSSIRSAKNNYWSLRPSEEGQWAKVRWKEVVTTWTVWMARAITVVP